LEFHAGSSLTSWLSVDGKKREALFDADRLDAGNGASVQ
jgi:hypothetical protein